MEGKSSTQNADIEGFSKHFCHMMMSDVKKSVRCSDRENFYHQIKQNLPCNATEIVRFLKTYENWLSFEKKRWLFWNLNFLKIGKSGKLALECVTNDIFFMKMFFPPQLSFFAEFIKNLNLEKLSKFAEDCLFFSKKTLSSFLKLSLTKLEGRKYAGGGRPSY